MSKYRFDYSPDSVYGHALAVLREIVPLEGGGIVLDVGCGNAPLADLISYTEATYVAADYDRESISELRARGFEAHELDLMRPDLVEVLGELVADRPVAAVLALDVIEHLIDPGAVLDALRGLGAPIVLSVPNVTHIDVGAKLVGGRWDVSDTGLLDSTHLQLFSEARLTQMLHAHGLRVVARRDFSLERSDQAFPESHPLLNPTTTVGALVRSLRDSAGPNVTVNQFIWGCVAAPIPQPRVEVAEERPFLSVVVRTRGTRVHELRETLLCLAGQTIDDFEVIVLGHRLEGKARMLVDRAIMEAQAGVAERATYIPVAVGGRSEVLNVGFEAARGRYIAVLDDDDLVFADWVEQFRALEAKHSGMLLRSRSVVQQHELVSVDGIAGTRAVAEPSYKYDRAFSIVEHMSDNHSPFMTIAFPRGIWHDLGLRFDPTLTTLEDYDMLLRSASLVGVADTPAITANYRQWWERDNSRTEHDQREWSQNHNHIQRKLDRQPLLLPIGASAEIRDATAERCLGLAREERLRAEVERLTEELAEVTAVVHDIDQHDAERLQLLAEATDMLASPSWRWPAPLRGARRLLRGGKPLRTVDLGFMNARELQTTMQLVRASRGWKLMRPLRRAEHRPGMR